MPKLICTDTVCRHEWTEAADPHQPRCPRCGGFWVRVIREEPAAERPRAPRRRARDRMLSRRSVNAL